MIRFDLSLLFSSLLFSLLSIYLLLVRPLHSTPLTSLTSPHFPSLPFPSLPLHSTQLLYFTQQLKKSFADYEDPQEVPHWAFRYRLTIAAVCFLLLCVALCVTVFEEDFAAVGWPRKKFLKIASIPFVSIIFTFCHIWLALIMTFHPLEYMGVSWVRWEGQVIKYMNTPYCTVLFCTVLYSPCKQFVFIYTVRTEQNRTEPYDETTCDVM